MSSTLAIKHKQSGPAAGLSKHRPIHEDHGVASGDTLRVRRYSECFADSKPRDANVRRSWRAAGCIPW